MIPLDDPVLYDTSLHILRTAVGQNFLGRPTQIFLAAKHYGKAIPQIGDPVGIQSGEFENLLDELYLKPSRPTPEKVLILFEDAHKVPSGTTGGVLNHPSNIWRNNLNLQKGYICFGSHQELLDPAFRNPSRLQCPHLQPSVPGTLAGATCALSPHPRPHYRGEDHARMIRKDAGSGEYWTYDPSDIAFYSSIVLPANGTQIPIAPLIVALYFDGNLAAGRVRVDTADFLADFDFSAAEYATYFEDDPASAAHQAFLVAGPAATWTRTPAQPVPPAQPALPGFPPIPVPITPAAAVPTSTTGTGTTTTSPPPVTGHWWSAEQAVRTVLENDGWQVLDVSRVGIGYDFKATKAGVVRLVEVKSAVGRCAPTLTDREYREAKQTRTLYVLAIVENYDPTKPVTIKWVQDPARLQVTARNTTAYYLPRSVWKAPSTDDFPA